MPRRNLAMELLQKLLRGELKIRRHENGHAQRRDLAKRILRKCGCPSDN